MKGGSSNERAPGGSIVSANGPTHIRSKALNALTGILMLLAAGIATGPLQEKLKAQVGDQVGAAQIQSLEQGAGQGIVLAVLGGFRTLMADILWLRTMQAWEQDDLGKTLSLIQFTTTVDPQPKFFWINGARIIANDMPHWVAATGTSQEQVRKDVQALAGTAIGLLEKAQLHHPEKPDMLMEIGHIHLNRLQDPETAAHYYGRAYMEFDNAPYYVGRLYAQLLRRVGRHREAYEFLTQLHPTLPDIIYAQKGVVLQRIRKLEKQLEIPEAVSFQPTRTP